MKEIINETNYNILFKKLNELDDFNFSFENDKIEIEIIGETSDESDEPIYPVYCFNLYLYIKNKNEDEVLIKNYLYEDDTYFYFEIENKVYYIQTINDLNSFFRIVFYELISKDFEQQFLTYILKTIK